MEWSDLVAIYTETLDPCGLICSFPRPFSHLLPPSSSSRPPLPMMSKRVHFARTTTVYSEDESSPSPSFSVSSLPSSSSSELPTPPPEEEENEDGPTVVYPVTPYATQALLDPPSPEIPLSPKPMHIHFMLAFSPFNDPAISWDVSYPPPAPSIPPENEQCLLFQQMLSEPATSPPLTALTITHSSLKWKIEVEPKDPAPGAYISVNDVFTTIFKELRAGIHATDYAELTDVEERSAVDTAYYSRCGRVPDPQARALEHQKGIKKVDMLMGRTKFLGLSGTLSGPEGWELNTS